jgi:type II secretory pathway pseudopilin PulG
LIELLLVISIMAVLATLAVSVIASAQEDSRVAASRARATLIQKAMEAELEDYEVRRSPIPFPAIGELTARVPESVWEGSSGPGDPNFLLHAKNLKRMIIADLVRSEFPSGRGGEPVRLGQFPSATLMNFLTGPLQIDPQFIDPNSPTSYFRRVRPANVSRWLQLRSDQNGSFAQPPSDINNPTEDEIEQLQADSSEVLYLALSQLDFDGTNMIDSLGTAAIGDTDDDGFLEIVDGFGDPMAFEFHQKNLTPGLIGASGGQTGVWVTPAGELEMDNFQTVSPILPTDLRFYVTSKKLFEIDGDPDDLQVRVN